MRILLLISLFALTFCCCDDDDGMPEPPPPPPVFNCEEVSCESNEEFYSKCVMNQECWVADGTFFDYSPEGASSIVLQKSEINEITEGINIYLYKNTGFQDTIYG